MISRHTGSQTPCRTCARASDVTASELQGTLGQQETHQGKKAHGLQQAVISPGNLLELDALWRLWVNLWVGNLSCRRYGTLCCAALVRPLRARPAQPRLCVSGCNRHNWIKYGLIY